MEPKLLRFDIPENGRPDSTHRLICYQWGNPTAERSILCVHGLTRNGRDFDFLASALAPDYQVLCPDMSGRGKSQYLHDPTGYNNVAYLADIACLLRSLNLTKIHWIGTSMGGILGMMMSNTQPGLIDALAINDIGCVIPAAGLQRIRDLADIKTTYGNMAEAEAAFRKRCAMFGIQDEAQWQHLLTHGLQQNDDGSISFTYDPGIFSAGFSKDAVIADINLWPLWEAVTRMPVLLIRGSESDILLPSTASEMQSRHPRLTYSEIKNVGHAPALMDHKQIALIQEWISAIESV